MTRERSGAGSRTNWDRTGTTSKQTTGKQTTGNRTTTKRPASGYECCHNGFGNKINSFKTLYSQTWGPAKCARPTAAMLNTFANWINKGAVVQTVSCSQVKKWAGSANVNFTSNNATATTCKNVLFNKFGKSTIKAVARTKSGSFMVATSPTWKGKPFCFPH